MCRSRERLAHLGMVACLVLATSAVGAPRAPLAFGFGAPATPATIAAWDIDVRPDGQGLPPGRGSVVGGQAIYDAKCASCHGTFGESSEYVALAGGIGTLGSGQPVRTTGSKLNYATTLFDYIRRAMPFPNPKSLNDDEVYALTAYVLNLNDILPADAVLDRESLPGIRMPNRDGFTTRHGFTRRDGAPDTHNVACMHDCARDVRVTSHIPDHYRDAHGDLAGQSRALGALRGVKTAALPPSVEGGMHVAAVSAAPPADVARRAGCMACHGVSERIVGPAFRDVAARYGTDGVAPAALVTKVRAGGSGAWGGVPMPPQTIPDGDLTRVVSWILAGCP